MIAVLIRLLMLVVTAAKFWKFAAFTAVVVAALTSAGRSIFAWLVITLGNLVLSVMNNFMPDLPMSVPSLIYSLPTDMQQILGQVCFPQCAQIIGSALIARFGIRCIPFVK